jgi:hypothetical protein
MPHSPFSPAVYQTGQSTCYRARAPDISFVIMTLVLP